MAQRLYTEWFVKFKFPGHEKVKMVNSPLGKIPKEWEVVSIGSLLEAIKRKPKIKKADYLVSGIYPIVDQGKEEIGGYTNEEGAVYKEELIVFGDHTRVIKFCNFPFACGADGTQLLKSNDLVRIPQNLFYFSILNSGLQNQHYARHFKFLKSLKILKPDKDLAEKFNVLVRKHFTLRQTLKEQNKNLAKTRDLLIPQLVTGRRELKNYE